MEVCLVAVLSQNSKAFLTKISLFSALASNLCFSVDDGQFISRSDLIDAPTCALARGAPVAGLGKYIWEFINEQGKIYKTV